MLKRFLLCERGANAIEYALIASIISVAAVIAMGKLGNSIHNSFDNTTNKLNV